MLASVRVAAARVARVVAVRTRVAALGLAMLLNVVGAVEETVGAIGVAGAELPLRAVHEVVALVCQVAALDVVPLAVPAVQAGLVVWPTVPAKDAQVAQIQEDREPAPRVAAVMAAAITIVRPVRVGHQHEPDSLAGLGDRSDTQQQCWGYQGQEAQGTEYTHRSSPFS